MKIVNREMFIWLLMMLLTLSTYAMGKFAVDGLAVVMFLLVTAAIKGGLIIRDFMALQGVALLWQIIMYGWLMLVCLTIAITYIVGL